MSGRAHSRGSSQLNLAGASRGTLPTSTGPMAALCGGAGEPVLLLPGFTGSKEDFGPLFAPLAEAGFAVTAIDLPGQYESPGPDDPAAYLPARLAGVVGEVAGALRSAAGGRRVHLLGHSFGGLVARAAVIAEPSAFRSLTLLCSGPAAFGGARAGLLERLEPLLPTEGLSGVYAARLEADRAQPGWVEPPAELAAFLRRRFLASPPAALIGMGRAIRTEPDRVAELAAHAVPTLVIYGAADDAWPPTYQDDMARRLGAQRVVVPEAAHSPAVENPSATAHALLRFWRAVPAA